MRNPAGCCGGPQERVVGAFAFEVQEDSVSKSKSTPTKKRKKVPESSLKGPANGIGSSHGAVGFVNK